jgi:hypothetical protein
VFFALILHNSLSKVGGEYSNKDVWQHLFKGALLGVELLPRGLNRRAWCMLECIGQWHDLISEGAQANPMDYI